MAERRQPPTIAELERALIDLGARLDYPPTPNLASAVRRRLESAPPRFQPRPTPTIARFLTILPFRRTWGWGLRVAALVLILLAATAVAVFPGAGAAIADRLGLRGIRIFYTAAVPTATTSPVPTETATSSAPAAAAPVMTPIGAGLRLGERITLAEARYRVAFPILTPTVQDLGPPDEVYLGSPPMGGQVALVYRARATLPAAPETGVGLLLTEFRADLAPSFFGKGLGPGTQLEQVTVNGEPGYWISGAPHLFFYTDPQGNIHDEEFRLATSTLLWEHNGVTFRLEAPMDKSEALRIAESIR